MRTAAARAAAPILAILASLMAAPAQAADPAVTLSLTERWQTTAGLGAWVPYTATVKNDGNTDFIGDLMLIPNDTVQRVVTSTWPNYRLHLTVQKGTEKAFTVFVVEAPSNYRGELRDAGGRWLVTADLQGGSAGGYAVGVLSDQHNADARVAGYKPLEQMKIGISAFPSATSFPNNAVFLSGLSAIVIDDFDTASLSQAQVQALKDFVGLGGSLVVAGGPSWRRTMLPLPGELSPLRPTASTTALLEPLAELAGSSTKQTASVASGEVRGQVMLQQPGDPPLAVRSTYGAGQVIDLAYDPLAEPFSSIEPALGTVAWSHGLAAALMHQGSNVRGFGPALAGTSGTGAIVGSAGPKPAVAAVAPGGGNAQSNLDQVFTVLQDTPVAAVPPIGLLGGLLLGYLLLVGPLNYLLMRAVRRRELLWVTVPAVSLIFTVGAYAVGFGTRGTDFVDNEVQLQRLGPDGALETQAYYGIYSPHKGDYWITFPGNTLVSTALNVDYSSISTEAALVDVAGKPRVQIQGAAIWSLRAAQSLSLTHQPLTIEPHLSLSGTQLSGTISNRGQRALGTVWAVDGVGGQAELASSLGPGQTVQVSQPLVSGGGSGSQVIPPPSVRTGTPSTTDSGAAPPTGALSAANKRVAVLRVAAAQAASGDPYDLNLVALSEPTGGLQVDGAHLTRYTVSAVMMPARLESIDSIGQTSPVPRLVATSQPTITEFVDVYDLELPPGQRAALDINYTVAGSQVSPVAKPTIRQVEVYDWSAGTWRVLSQPPGVAPQASTRDAIAPGEAAGGVIRVRVHEARQNNAATSLKLMDRPAPAPGRAGT